MSFDGDSKASKESCVGDETTLQSTSAISRILGDLKIDEDTKFLESWQLMRII